MGEYHKRYIRSLFDTEEDYQNYINRKLHISWKSSAQTVFSGIYLLENLIDEKGTISNSDKEDIMDFFCKYAKEREKEINNLEKAHLQIPSKEKTNGNTGNKKPKCSKSLNSFLASILGIAILVIGILVMIPLFSAPEYPAKTNRKPENNYVASINSDKYHNLSCDYAKKIKEENRLYYETEGEARKAGKSPCSVCIP